VKHISLNSKFVEIRLKRCLYSKQANETFRHTNQLKILIFIVTSMEFSIHPIKRFTCWIAIPYCA